MHGFNTITEREFKKEETEDKHLFNLKLATVLGHGNRQYIRLLIFSVEVKYRLNPRDKLTINFKPEVDSRA